MVFLSVGASHGVEVAGLPALGNAGNRSSFQLSKAVGKGAATCLAGPNREVRSQCWKMVPETSVATDQFLRQTIAVSPKLLQGIAQPGQTDWADLKGSLTPSVVAAVPLTFLSGFFPSGQSVFAGIVRGRVCVCVVCVSLVSMRHMRYNVVPSAGFYIPQELTNGRHLLSVTASRVSERVRFGHDI